MDETNALLEQLNDIQLPEQSGFMPAIGWVVLFCLLVLLMVVGWFLRRSRKSSQSAAVPVDWQSPALSELEQITARVNSGETAGALADCSRLTRRVTIALASRPEVAGLTGGAWLHKLDELSRSHFYTQGHGRLLAAAPYQATMSADQAQLREIVAAIKTLIGPQADSALDDTAVQRDASLRPLSVASAGSSSASSPSSEPAT